MHVCLHGALFADPLEGRRKWVVLQEPEHGPPLRFHIDDQVAELIPLHLVARYRQNRRAISSITAGPSS